MNFLGHAAVARAITRSAGNESLPSDHDDLLLGAMLPDLQAMAGVTPTASPSASVAEGVTLHLATDQVFHVTPAFTALLAAGHRELDAAGVSRGPRRATAHIGVELLMDGVLADDTPLVADVRRIVTGAHHASVGVSAASDRPAWDRVRGRIRDRHVPDRYRDPDFVADRVLGMLARRPRLAPESSEESAIRAWVAGVQPAVRAATPALMAQTLAALTSARGSSSPTP